MAERLVVAVAGQPPRRRATTVVLTVLGQSTQALAFGAIALFLPLIRDDLHITFGQAGVLGAATTVVYAVMQIPAGALADRYDPKVVFFVGLIGVNITSLLFALLSNYSILVVVQATSGLFRALLFAPGLLLISSQFPKDRVATAMGLFVVGGFSSNVLLNLLGPFVVGLIGWRNLVGLFTMSGLIVTVLFRWLVPAGSRPVHESTAIVPGQLRALLAQPVLWLCGIVQFVRLAVVTGMAFWLPSIVVDDKGYSLVVGGIVVAVGSAVVGPSNVLGGWLSDRANRPLPVIGISLAMLAVTIVLVPSVSSLPALIAVVVANAVFLQLYFGPLFAIPLLLLGTRNAGFLSGFGNLCANLGGFVATLSFGFVKDATGSFNTGLYALAGLCLVGLGATAGLAALERRQRLGIAVADGVARTG